MTSSFGLRSTGLVIFSGRIVSAFTGYLFALMATRTLLAGGYGTLEVIVTILTFSSYPIGVVAYWATRDVARGRMVGRTALVTGALLSSLGLFIYFGFSLPAYSRIGSSVMPFLLGALLVPLAYWSATANSIVTGYRPSVYGYSLVISEFAKLGVAYEALYVFRLGIEGAILALMVAYLVQSLVSTFMVRPTVSERFEPVQVRRWSKLAWLPLLNYLPAQLAVADSLLIALTHGTSVVGIYQGAFMVASIVTYATSLVAAMYPLLLKGGDSRLPSLGLEFSMLFAIPMAAGCIALAGPILYLFGPEFVLGALCLEILSVMFVFNNLSLLLDQTLMGTEKVDAGETPSFRRVVRSNLMFVTIVNIAYGITYLVALFIAVSYATSAGFSDSSVVAIWASVQLAATVVFMLVKLRRSRGVAQLAPSLSMAYYLVAAAVMGVVVYLVAPAFAVQTVGIVSGGLRLLALVLLGSVVYFGLVYFLDKKFRDLAQSFLHRL